MESRSKSKKQIKVLTGNATAAWAVMLCRPDVICAYPITPQTELVDVLYRLQAEGLLKCESVEPEGEHSVMSILIGASLAGARTFSATSAQGLFFMFEPYLAAALQRLPIVLVNVNREMLPPTTVAGSGQDIMEVKDSGWIQIHVESCQEVIDAIIMAFRLAEDPEILLPIQVCFDGYFISHRSEPVEIPAQELVDQFLPKRQRTPRLDPLTPLTSAPFVSPEMLTEYRVKHMAALQRSRTKFEDIDEEFGRIFGRSYGGQLEEYRCDDAEIVLVTLGSCTGTARVIVDQKREQGIKVGLIKLRMFRPFPREEVVTVLSGRKAIGVIDRDVCFGWNCGHLLVELRAAISGLGEHIPMLNFIGGLNGGDITLPQIESVVDNVQLAAEGKPCKEVTFLRSE